VLTWYVAHLDFTGFDVLQTSGEDWLLPFRDTPPRIRTYWGSAIGEAWSSTRARRLLAQAFLFYPLEYASAVKTRRRVGISSITARQQPLVTDIIPPGVDVSTFHPGAKAPHPVILFVSHRLGGRKRGPALVEAFERVVKPALPDAELWMRCSEEVPSPEGVRWFRTVDPTTLADLYRKAWVMCLPSAYEGFGIPYVEALASGTAVVATPNYGAREILEDGKFGVLTSLSGLGQSLMRLLQDAPRLACLSANGPARARDFSWDEVAERYVAVYRAAVRA
jgi:glycosyltransferase involved in cell wall biosynthesis